MNKVITYCFLFLIMTSVVIAESSSTTEVEFYTGAAISEKGTGYEYLFWGVGIIVVVLIFLVAVISYKRKKSKISKVKKKTTKRR